MKRFFIPFILTIFAALVLLPQAYAYEVGYAGGFYFLSDDGNNKIKLGLKFQPKYEYIKTLGLRVDDVNTFDMRRMSMSISGHAMSPKFTYSTAINLKTGKIAPGSGVDINIHPAFAIAAGYDNGSVYTVEWNSSSSYLPFIDFSIITDHFAGDVGTGIWFHGDVDRLHYTVGVANGNSDIANKNKEMVLNGRLELDILGSPGGSTEDFKRSETPQLALGVASIYDLGNDVENTGGRENDLLVAGSDIQFRYMGFTLIGELHYGRNLTFSQYDYGYLIHAAYFIIAEKLELAARYAAVIPQGGTSFRPVGGVTHGSTLMMTDTSAALSYFLLSNRAKLQAAYKFTTNVDGEPTRDNHSIAAQMTLLF